MAIQRYVRPLKLTANGQFELQTPGAGPSRRSIEVHEDEEREEFLKLRSDYIELSQAVDTSTELLVSLSSYLSTFQNDLSAVSGQISDLQGRSDDIESQLRGRKAIGPPLQNLVNEIILSPSLVLTLRDTLPASNPDLWLSAIQQLEAHIVSHRSRPNVKAVRDLDPIIEGLRTKALTSLPPFLLSLIRPLRSSSTGLSTNLAVLQTSLLLKYQPFYAFLLRQSPRIAKQVERGYVNAARAYYETGMRRYTRALSVIRARTPEKAESMGSVSSEAAREGMGGGGGGFKGVYDRLRFAELDSEGDAGVVLAYMADEKDYTTPVESLFRSLSLVLLDNASAEFTFLVRFFGRSIPSPNINSTPSRSREGTPLESPIDHLSEAGRSLRRTPDQSSPHLKDAERIFHEILDPALSYAQTFFTSLLAPLPPPSIPLLTVIRLNDRILQICDSRGTIPLMSVLQGWKLSLWPLWRKGMDGHVESVKGLADLAEGKGLAGIMGKGVKDGVVRIMAGRYAGMFTCLTALSDEAEEGMIFGSMLRLRTELIRLVTTQSKKLKSPPDRHAFLSSIYEIIMHELVSGPGQTTHPKIQSELSFFRTREEEARRAISN